MWVVHMVIVSVIALAELFVISFNSLEYQKMALNNSWVSETVDDLPDISGRYYLGFGSHFIKFRRLSRAGQHTGRCDAGVGPPEPHARWVEK